MKSRFLPSTSALALLTGAFLASAPATHAQTGYVVDVNGLLSSFDVSTPGSRTSIGNLGFIPTALDFRPGTTTLYAFRAANAGAFDNAGIYTVNTSTGAAALVGSGFNNSALGSSTSFGFDFNPTTLQGDGSIRIRLVGNSGLNLRLNSNTGLISNTDTGLTGPGSAATSVAYTRTDFADIMGTGTALFYINPTNDTLNTTTAANGGATTQVGTGLGVDINAAATDNSFDIFTGGSTNTGYATSGNNFYSVNLTTGVATLIGTNANGFTGGFAVLTTPIPEPSTFAALAGVAALGLAATARRRRAPSA